MQPYQVWTRVGGLFRIRATSRPGWHPTENVHCVLAEVAVFCARMGRTLVRLAMMVGYLLPLAPPVFRTSLHDAFKPEQAFAYCAEIAGFGERWPGSPGHTKTESLIHQVLEKDGAKVESDDFVATTPLG